MQYELSYESFEVCRISADDFDALVDEFITAFAHTESLFEGLK